MLLFEPTFWCVATLQIVLATLPHAIFRSVRTIWFPKPWHVRAAELRGGADAATPGAAAEEGSISERSSTLGTLDEGGEGDEEDGQRSRASSSSAMSADGTTRRRRRRLRQNVTGFAYSTGHSEGQWNKQLPAPNMSSRQLLSIDGAAM